MFLGPSKVQLGLGSYEWLTKLDGGEVGAQFVCHEYDYKQNWTTKSPVTD